MARGDSDRIGEVWDKIWRDKHDEVVVFQAPNIWIVAWVVLIIASIVMPSGNAQNVVWWLSEIVLAVWSLLEIFRGVNYFRRGLGVVVMALVIVTALGLGR